jgi:hypothetical protein
MANQKGKLQKKIELWNALTTNSYGLQINIIIKSIWYIYIYTPQNIYMRLSKCKWKKLHFPYKLNLK